MSRARIQRFTHQRLVVNGEEAAHILGISYQTFVKEREPGGKLEGLRSLSYGKNLFYINQLVRILDNDAGLVEPAKEWQSRLTEGLRREDPSEIPC